MKQTEFRDLDEALAVLNAARRTFNPAIILINYEGGAFSFDDRAGNLPAEFDRALGLIQYAVTFANRLLEGKSIIEDYRGHWVAMRAA
jgi:hypothetical protein